MTTATLTLKAERDAILKGLMGHTLGQVADDRGGWASDRLNALTEVQWDLCEADDSYRPVSWAGYVARLLKAGKGMSYRPGR